MGVRITLRINTAACAEAWSIGLVIVKSKAEKGAMLAKINVPAISEVGLVAATIGEAHGDGKGRWQRGMGIGFRCVI